ncbi:hypothetical protein [Allorhizocola rhizosphaerae]|nr:hypothetical protein [Allorhizocola rhizosphaerae]
MTTFQGPVFGKDVSVTARLTKLGKSLAFADITRRLHATTVHAIL